MFSVFIRVEMIFLLAFKTWWNFVVSFRHPFILIFLWSLHDFALSLSSASLSSPFFAAHCSLVVTTRFPPPPLSVGEFSFADSLSLSLSPTIVLLFEEAKTGSRGVDLRVF
ncbi:hypothetical protein AAZX31_08G029000 [Glycine max]